MRRLLAALLCALLLFPAAGLADGERVSGVGFYFDTVVTITLYDAPEGLLDELWQLCGRYENLLSKTVEGSDVWRINHAGGETLRIDPETRAILECAAEVHAASGGAFCITIAPVVALWDFTGGTERMPTEEELAAALPLVDDGRLILGGDDTVTLPAGMEIDLGGIAKGYIADRVAEAVRGRVSGAVLNFGGNVYTVGHKPGGAPYSIGVRDPLGAEGSSLCAVSLYDGTVVTSGIYERCFDRDGVRYHHILDPQTGTSAQTDLASATVMGESSMLADACATACVVLGSEQALALLDRMGLDGLLILRDNSLLMTEGYAETYQLRYLQ